MAEERVLVEADEFTGSGPEDRGFNIRAYQSPTVLRFINELDAQVNVSVDLTHEDDVTFDYPQPANTYTVRGGTGNPEDGAGSAKSDVLTEPWDRARVTITPASEPTGGYLRVLEMGQTGGGPR